MLNMNVQFKCMMVPNMRDTHRSIPKSDLLMQKMLDVLVIST